MKTIQVHDITVQSGQEFMASSYPHDGLFLLRTGQLVARFGGCATSIFGVPATAFMEDGKPAPAGGGGAGGVSEATLLRAIAIVQQPQLAVSLVGGAA